MEKVDRDSNLYRKREIEIAFSYAPSIYPCYHCGNPVAKGYCCLFCHSSDPQGYEARREASK